MSAFFGWLIGMGWHELDSTLGAVLALLGLAMMAAAVWRRQHVGTGFLLFGGSLICLGCLIGSFTSRFIDAGSGQDAVWLAAWGIGWIVSLFGILSILIGFVALAIRRRRAYGLTTKK